MTGHRIYISIDRAYNAFVSKRWLRSVVARVLAEERIPGEIEVSLLVTGDETVRRLNRDYRQADRTTDVLAFSLIEDEGQFEPPPDGVIRLGDVIISYPRAEKQARRAKHSLKSELALLAVHGVLHLLGYDHEAEPEKRLMWQRQKIVLAVLAGLL